MQQEFAFSRLKALISLKSRWSDKWKPRVLQTHKESVTRTITGFPTNYACFKPRCSFRRVCSNSRNRQLLSAATVFIVFIADNTFNSIANHLRNFSTGLCSSGKMHSSSLNKGCTAQILIDVRVALYVVFEFLKM